MNRFQIEQIIQTVIKENTILYHCTRHGVLSGYLVSLTRSSGVDLLHGSLSSVGAVSVDRFRIQILFLKNQALKHE